VTPLAFCLLLAASPPAATTATTDLPSAQPAAVGLSPERLARIDESFRRVVDEKQIAGAVQPSNAHAASTRPVAALLTAKKTYAYKSVGDCSIRADVFRPDDERPRPVILWLHGGAFIWGSRTRIRTEQLDRYVKEGFVVVAMDYRLAPETKLPAILDDLKDAYEWIRKAGPALFHADPDRIVVVGHSAGGYLALMGGLILTPPPRALVSFYGYGDISGDWCNHPDAHYSQQPAVSREAAGNAVGSAILTEALYEQRWPFYLYCRQQGRWAREVAGEEADVERFCPVRHVTQVFPPTLLLHGNQDTDVPFEQSVRMAEELRGKGVPCELITLADRGHAFDSGDGMGDPPVANAFERVIRFIKERADR
jgi:acetyl esterase/lipase